MRQAILKRRGVALRSVLHHDLNYGGVSVRLVAFVVFQLPALQSAWLAWNVCFTASNAHVFGRGISLAQDSRFKSADKKLLAKMKFAPELDQKIDLNKVEIGAFISHLISSTSTASSMFLCRLQLLTRHSIPAVAFRVWVAQRITSILGFEDEVVVELVFGHLEVRALV